MDNRKLVVIAALAATVLLGSLLPALSAQRTAPAGEGAGTDPFPGGPSKTVGEAGDGTAAPSVDDMDGEVGDGSPAVNGGSRAASPAAVQYLIVAPDHFVDELAPLVEWKTRKGVPAKIATVSEIESSMSGPDQAARIHNYINETYREDNSLWFVLLAGDSEHVPTRMIATNGSELSTLSRDEYPCDGYYAGLDNDWDNDGDGTYGEPWEEDWYADVYVGRIPASSESEMAMNVQRIIDYETDPAPGGWLDRALFASGLLDSPNLLDDGGTPDIDEGYGNWEDNGKEMTDNILPYFPKDMGRTFLYDYNQTNGGSWSLAADTLDQESFMEEYERGYSMVSIASHGYHSRNGTAHYLGPTGTERTDCWTSFFHWSDTGTVGNGDMLPFVYISACFVMDFTETEDTNFEQLFTNPDGGAIGAVGPTDFTYRGELPSGESYGNWRLARYYWDILFDGPDMASRTLGGALYEAKEDYLGYLLTRPFFNRSSVPLRMNMASYNLLGDPELHIWNATPATMNVTVDPVFLDSDRILVRVTENGTDDPVLDAGVVAWHQDVYDQAQTNSLGVAKVPSSFATAGTLKLTVLRDGYLPALIDLNVGPRPADLVVESGGVGVSKAHPVDGDEITVTAGVYNKGGKDADDVKVAFFWGDPADGDALGDPYVIPTVTAGTGPNTAAPASVVTTARGGEWRITVAVDPDDDIVEVDEGNNTANITLDSEGPDLVLSQGALEDYDFPTFNPLVLPRGINGSVAAVVGNDGDAPASRNATVEVLDVTADATGTVLYTADAGPLAVGGSAAVSIPFSPLGDSMSLRFIVDPDGKVYEEDEGNNRMTVTYTVRSAPVLAVPALSMDEDGTLESLDLLQYASDEDTDIGGLTVEILKFTCRTLDAGAKVVAGRYFTLESRNDTYGEVQLFFRLHDGELYHEQAVTMTIEPVNDPPRIDTEGLGPPIHLDEKQEYNETIEAHDVEGTNITFSDDTELFDIEPSTGRIRFTPGNDDVGTHVVNVTVRDGDGLTTNVTLTFVIRNVNDPPQILDLEGLPPYELKVGEPYELRIRAVDPDGDDLEFSDNTTLFEIGPSTGIINFTPGEGDGGTHWVSITVSDGRAATSATIILVVEGGDGTTPGGEPAGKGGRGAMIAAGAAVVVIVIILMVVTLMRAGAAAGVREGEEEDEELDVMLGEKRRVQVAVTGPDGKTAMVSVIKKRKVKGPEEQKEEWKEGGGEEMDGKGKADEKEEARKVGGERREEQRKEGTKGGEEGPGPVKVGGGGPEGGGTALKKRKLPPGMKLVKKGGAGGEGEGGGKEDGGR